MAAPKGNLFVPIGFRSDGSSHALELDNTDKLKVLIHAESPSLLTPLPKSSRYQNINLLAGTNDLTIFTVPASEYWRIHLIGVFYVGTVAGVILTPYINNTAVNLRINHHAGIASNQSYVTNVNALFGPGYIMKLFIDFATAGDDVTFDYFAERVY